MVLKIKSSLHITEDTETNLHILLVLSKKEYYRSQFLVARNDSAKTLKIIKYSIARKNQSYLLPSQFNPSVIWRMQAKSHRYSKYL